MLKWYFLAGALALMAIQAYYSNIQKAEIKALKAENQLLQTTQDSLNRAMQELKARHAKELETIKNLDENKTQIIHKIDAVKAKISQDKSDIVVKFNKTLDEIYNNL
jgi:predicted  nucleic acid-binding Zn-ribbon protein